MRHRSSRLVIGDLSVDRKDPAPTPQLADCFMEIMAYTGYLTQARFSVQPSFDEVFGYYKLLVARSDTARRGMGISDTEWKSGLFPVCAWADERILCSGWNERSRWAQAQLQLELFQTTKAGEEFFHYLANIPRENRPVRAVYDLCMAMGFKGRYFLPGDEAVLDRVRKDNFACLADGSSFDFQGEVFPGTGQYAKPERRRRRMRRIVVYNTLVVLIPIAAFAILYLLYYRILDTSISFFMAR